MPRRIVIIQAHPDPDPARLCRVLADAYAEAAAEAGHHVARIDLAHLEIPFLRSRAEFEHGEIPAQLRPAVDAIREAEHVVIVFPLWLGTMPALLKAFLEQVMRPGTAFAYRDRGLPEKRLAGRTARLVVTMGMPAAIYRWWFGAWGVRVLERNILAFVGIKPAGRTLLGMVEGGRPARQEGWIAAMRRLGRAGR